MDYLELKQQKEWADKQIAAVQSRLSSAPKGHLHVSTMRGTQRYYLVDEDTRARTYLSQNKTDLIGRLEQKAYDTRVLKILVQERGDIVRSMKHNTLKRIDALYAELPEGRKEYVEPVIVPDEIFRAQWEAQEYASLPIEPGCRYITEKGEKVRSKSEVIIANALASANVPYHYERPLQLRDWRSVYPDFTVLNVHTREEFYWEHLGMMTDQDYCNKALEKIAAYDECGIVLGKQLIITMESAQCPLSTHQISSAINEFLC